LSEGVDADVIIHFETSKQMMQREASLEQRSPLGGATGHERFFLSCRYKMSLTKFLKQGQPEEYTGDIFTAFGKKKWGKRGPRRIDA
jgi:hypothetical protein